MQREAPCIFISLTKGWGSVETKSSTASAVPSSPANGSLKSTHTRPQLSPWFLPRFHQGIIKMAAFHLCMPGVILKDLWNVEISYYSFCPLLQHNLINLAQFVKTLHTSKWDIILGTKPFTSTVCQIETAIKSQQSFSKITHSSTLYKTLESFLSLFLFSSTEGNFSKELKKETLNLESLCYSHVFYSAS